MSFTLRPARQSSGVSDAEAAAWPAAEPAATPTPETNASDAAVGRLRPSLASLLADEGVATMDQLEEALAEGMKSGERLGEVVLRRGWINEAGLAQLIARRWDLTFVARSMITVDEHAQALLSRADAERLGASPVAFNDGVPQVAVADPSEERFSDVRAALGTQCTFVVTTPSALAQLIADAPEAAPQTPLRPRRSTWRRVRPTSRSRPSRSRHPSPQLPSPHTFLSPSPRRTIPRSTTRHPRSRSSTACSSVSSPTALARPIS
jgi:hypothetical protein